MMLCLARMSVSGVERLALDAFEVQKFEKVCVLFFFSAKFCAGNDSGCMMPSDFRSVVLFFVVV